MRAVPPIDVDQSLDNLKLERDAIVLYDALAGIEKDPRRADAFRRIAGERAAARRDLGGQAARARRDRAARPTGRGCASGSSSSPPGSSAPRAVADLVKALEGDEEGLYVAQGASPEVAAIAADEREHAIIWDQLKAGDQFGDVTGDGRDGVAIARRATSAAEIGNREAWHRTGGRSGTLRAVIFGVSDGLVSNLSLVMGVAGASSGNPSFILLAGIAGLLAGAFSMAAGEYISMQSQRELFERQIALERAEMEAMPEEEEAELAAAYRAKGFAPDEAAGIAHRIFARPGDGPRHARPRGARARSGRARLAVEGGRRLLRRLRHRRDHPGHPVSVRWRDRGPAGQPRPQPRGPVHGRRRGEPADRTRPDLLGLPAARHRAGRGPRDLPDRLDHRRRARSERPGPDGGSHRTASRRGPRPQPAGRTDRATATPRTTTATTRSSSSSVARSVSVCRGRARRTRRSTWPRATASSCRRGRATTPSSDRVAWPASRRTGRPGPSIGSLAARPGRGERPSGLSGVGYRLAEGNPMDAPARMP